MTPRNESEIQNQLNEFHYCKKPYNGYPNWWSHRYSFFHYSSSEWAKSKLWFLGCKDSVVYWSLAVKLELSFCMIFSKGVASWRHYDTLRSDIISLYHFIFIACDVPNSTFSLLPPHQLSPTTTSTAILITFRRTLVLSG